ncbi:MAG: excisionase [Lachnospiraceae bacterium]|nr:excisionase [Lachnospiraceae bacterium]
MKCTLMHKNIEVVSLEIDDLNADILKVTRLADLNHLPVGCLLIDGRPDRASLNDWWRGRAIPASRSGIREALAEMDISHTEQLLTKCYGLSLSDHYWVNPEDNPLDWDKINFFDNTFSEDVGNILFGQAILNDDLDLISPDNTSDGWLKKKWKISGNMRVLIKGGSTPYRQEPLNEVLATALYRRLGTISHIPYSLKWDDGLPYSICENFITKDTELVSAYRINLAAKKMNHHSTYEHFLSCCETLGIPGMADFLDYQLATDYLIANTDRHFNNFGAIRDPVTLEWLGPAPIFDSGTSLWHDLMVLEINKGIEVKSKPFKATHSKQISLVNNFRLIDFSTLAGLIDEFRGILSTSPFIEEERAEVLCQGLARRIEQLQNIAE